MMKKKTQPTTIFNLVIGALLLLSACSPAGTDNAQPLADSSWELVSMPGFEGLGDLQLTLNFDAQGAIAGNGGCNNYGGSYEAIAAKESIEFSQIFSTEMWCEEGNASNIESAFFQVLAAAQSYSQTLEFLRLNGPNGTLEFAVAP